MTNHNSEPGQDDKLPAGFFTLRAVLLAQEGRHEEAQLELDRISSDVDPNELNDLRARMAVLRGDMEEAQLLWSKVLSDKPGDVKATNALRTLDEIESQSRVRYLRKTVTVILFGALALSPLAYTLLQKGDVPVIIAAPSPSQPVEPEDLGEDTRNIIVETKATAAEATDDEVEQSPSEVTEVLIPWYDNFPQIDGFSVSVVDNEVVLTPDSAMFKYRTVMQEGSGEVLERLPLALKPYVTNFWLIVDGYTDSDPMPLSSAYTSNYDLGLDRARTVANLLNNQDGTLNGSIVRVQSYGDHRLLYEEADDESKLRNRTVVIRIVPKTEK